MEIFKRKEKARKICQIQFTRVDHSHHAVINNTWAYWSMVRQTWHRRYQRNYFVDPLNCFSTNEMKIAKVMDNKTEEEIIEEGLSFHIRPGEEQSKTDLQVR